MSPGRQYPTRDQTPSQIHWEKLPSHFSAISGTDFEKSDKSPIAHQKSLPRPPSWLHPIRHRTLSLTHKPKVQRIWRMVNGYHFAIYCCAWMTAGVLLVNLTFTIWATATFGVQSGLGTLQEGHCKETKNLTQWIHLGINVLSTLLLGASNYSMQCLSSPTRREIDIAHSKGTWLDVGVPSMRNLRKISWSRIVFWWLLALSSIPLHLLYNSAIFSSLSTRDYNLYIVSHDFFDRPPLTENYTRAVGFSSSRSLLNPLGPKSDPSPALLQLKQYQRDQSTLQNLTNGQVIRKFTAPVLSTYSDLLLVSSRSNASYPVQYTTTLGSPITKGESMKDWYCNGLDCSYCNGFDCNYDSGGESPWVINGTILENAENWSIEGVPIGYGLARQVPEQCTLQFSLAIMIVVIICNLIKAACMGITAWRQDPAPLVTLGDAIASFLDRPDPTTEGKCIAGKHQFAEGEHWDSKPVEWSWKRQHWFRAASKRRWIINIVL